MAHPNRNKRNFCKKLCNKFAIDEPNKVFENIVMLLIITSSILLAIDNPLNDPDSKFNETIKIIDQIHTVLFTIEAMIKIIGLGMVRNKL